MIRAGLIVLRVLPGSIFAGVGQTEAEAQTDAQKLIRRIAAGGSGGCPVLVFGILPGNILPG